MKSVLAKVYLLLAIWWLGTIGITTTSVIFGAFPHSECKGTDSAKRIWYAFIVLPKYILIVDALFFSFAATVFA